MINPLEDLIPTRAPDSVATISKIALVLDLEPLTIILEGDEEPLEIEPSVTVEGLLVGDTVKCDLIDNDLIITGRLDPDFSWYEAFSDGIASAQGAADAAAESAADAAAGASGARERAEEALARSVSDPSAILSTGATGSVKVAGGVLTVAGDDDVPQTILTPGASVFRGDAEIENIVVTCGGKLSNVEIEAGSTITLGSSVSAPTTPPGVNSVWPTIKLSGPNGSISVLGITRDPVTGEWISAVKVNTTSIEIYRHNASSGAYVETLGSFALSGGSRSFPSYGVKTVTSSNWGLAWSDGEPWVFITTWRGFATNGGAA